MSKPNQAVSAGILLYKSGFIRQVYLAHMGGPYWEKKDVGAWSIPKGLVESDEDLLEAAKRELAEETGYIATGVFLPLDSVTMKNGKTIHIWGNEVAQVTELTLKSNTFHLEWPKGSGVICEFPEMDRGQWVSVEEGLRQIVPVQRVFLERMAQHWSGVSS